MDNREKIRWLKRYIICGRLAEQLENELARWRSLAEKSTTSIQPVPGGGGCEDKLPRMVEHLVELEEKLKKRRSECLCCRLAIEKAIAKVSEERLQLVLRYLYVNGFSMEKVAVELGYSYSHIKLLHGLAISQIKDKPQ